MKDNTMRKITLTSVPMFNAPGMLRWARHFYRMTNCPKKDRKYFLGVMESWVIDKKTAKYCLECPDCYLEWDDEAEKVTITIEPDFKPFVVTVEVKI